jgi:hypothetical protein
MAAEAARKKRLDALAKRVDAAWTELEALVEKSTCEEAIKLAIDPRDLAKRDDASVPFAAPFEARRKRQLRRRGFFDRWKRENELSERVKVHDFWRLDRLEKICAPHFVWPGKGLLHPPGEKSNAGA